MPVHRRYPEGHIHLFLSKCSSMCIGLKTDAPVARWVIWEEKIPMKRLETDLHLHLDGSLSLESARTLAEGRGYHFTDQELHQRLIVRPDCRSLEEFLQCFELPGLLLQDAESLEYSAYELLGRLAGQNVIYSEIRFAPQLHRRAGMSQQQAVEAVIRGTERGMADFGVDTGILLCAMVNGSDKDNLETMELAEGYLGKGVVGADLAGPEGFVPMKHFKGMFAKACRGGVPLTIHAGECGDYENVALAVSYGARRIGHGCAAIKSEACMELLKKERITLEMCVISNLITRAVDSLEVHPLKKFYDRGIPVTYNTDDMAVCDSTLEKEADLLLNRMGFTEADLQVMNENAIGAAFAPDSVKTRLLRRLAETK